MKCFDYLSMQDCWLCIGVQILKWVVNVSLNGIEDFSASTSSPPPLFVFKEGFKAKGEGKSGNILVKHRNHELPFQ